MSTRRPGTGDPADDEADLDPTGIRALLSSLPDPGPMPADLAARITARLAAEVGPAPLVGAEPVHDHGHPGDDLTARRHRRRRTFGLVAASAALIGLGGTAMLTDAGPTDLQAALGGGSSGSDEELSSESDSGSSGAGGDSGLRAATDGGLAGVAPAARAQFVFTDTAWTPANLAASADALLPPPSEKVLPSLAAEAPSIGPIMTPVGAGACAAALGLDPASVLVVDLGTWESRPAAMLVVESASGGGTGGAPGPTGPGAATGSAGGSGGGHADEAAAYVVDRYCSVDSAGVLAGPVQLP